MTRSTGSPPAGDRVPPGLVSDSFAVARWTLLSRVSGFGRVAAIAAVLGPTHLGNLFQTANLLPNLTYEFLSGSLVASLLVPGLVRHLDKRRNDDEARLACGFLGVALVAMAVAVALIVLAGPLVLRLLAAGVDDAGVVADQERVGVIFLAILMPQVVLYGVVGVGAAVQNAHGRFALPAAAPLVENGGVILTVVASAFIFGTGADVDTATTGQILLLGLGSTSAVALHAVVQWWGARRCGVTLVPRWGWRDTEVRQLARLAVPTVGYTGLNALRHFVILVVSNAIPGGVIAFQLALNFYNLPVALGAKPCAVALLPRLARLEQKGDSCGFAQEFGRGLRLALFLTVPAAVAFITLAWPLARGFSFGEMATATGIGLVAAALASLAPGMIGDSAFWVATNACYARRDASAPLRAMGLRVGLVALGAVPILLNLDGRSVLIGLGITVAIADLIGGGYLWRRVRSRLPRATPVATSGVTTMALSSAAMAIPLLAMVMLVDPRGRLVALVSTAAAGLLGLGAYLGVQRARGSSELASVVDVVRPRSALPADRR